MQERRFGCYIRAHGSEHAQQNGKVERKFATLYGKVRSMLNRARLPEKWRSGIWTKAASTATFNENLLVTNDKSKPSYESFYGKEHPKGRELRVFGEMGVVKLNWKIKGKLVVPYALATMIDKTKVKG